MEKKSKLSLNKMRICKINNMSVIRGGILQKHKIYPDILSDDDEDEGGKTGTANH